MCQIPCPPMWILLLPEVVKDVIFFSVRDKIILPELNFPLFWTTIHATGPFWTFTFSLTGIHGVTVVLGNLDFHAHMLTSSKQSCVFDAYLLFLQSIFGLFLILGCGLTCALLISGIESLYHRKSQQRTRQVCTISQTLPNINRSSRNYQAKPFPGKQLFYCTSIPWYSTRNMNRQLNGADDAHSCALATDAQICFSIFSNRMLRTQHLPKRKEKSNDGFSEKRRKRRGRKQEIHVGYPQKYSEEEIIDKNLSLFLDFMFHVSHRTLQRCTLLCEFFTLWLWNIRCEFSSSIYV